MTPLDGGATIPQATEACKTVCKIMPRGQFAIVTEGCRTAERQWFKDKLVELARVFNAMPTTYKNRGDDAIAHLHYFIGNCDWYITERDVGDPDDAPEDELVQCYGLANIGYGYEAGYISIPEIVASKVELDLHYKPITVREIRAKEKS